jgi:hypothetical protein
VQFYKIQPFRRYQSQCLCGIYGNGFFMIKISWNGKSLRVSFLGFLPVENYYNLVCDKSRKVFQQRLFVEFSIYCLYLGCNYKIPII